MTRRNRENLKSDYLEWLERQLRDEHGNPDKSYWELLNIMFEKEFRWQHPMDENRMMDGLDVRVEFANEHRIRPHVLDFLGPCSFLELLIALSRQMAFVAGGDAPGWAWHLLNNLELNRMSDPLTRPKRNKIAEILDNVIDRRYSPDGTGGFFPLAWPEDDMTNVELWYQLNAYISELHPEHREH
jgi:hypothetical protein